MGDTMQAVRVYADWDPKPGFKLGVKDIEGRQTYLGSQVWRNPKLKIEEVEVPKPKGNQVLVQVRACGICGTDVHIVQTDDEGYMFYPGLTGFPSTLGHELSGGFFCALVSIISPSFLGNTLYANCRSPRKGG